MFWPILFDLSCVTFSIINYGKLCLFSLFLHNTCTQSQKCNLYSHWVTLKVFFASLCYPQHSSLSLPLAGTTCLVALLSDRELTVANVGDSRGVLCDKDGNAVALSHDHKPYQLKERKRIKRAGRPGFGRYLCCPSLWLVYAGVLDSICWSILERLSGFIIYIFESRGLHQF